MGQIFCKPKSSALSQDKVSSLPPPSYSHPYESMTTSITKISAKQFMENYDKLFDMNKIYTIEELQQVKNIIARQKRYYEYLVSAKTKDSEHIFSTVLNIGDLDIAIWDNVTKHVLTIEIDQDKFLYKDWNNSTEKLIIERFVAFSKESNPKPNTNKDLAELFNVMEKVYIYNCAYDIVNKINEAAKAHKNCHHNHVDRPKSSEIIRQINNNLWHLTAIHIYHYKELGDYKSEIISMIEKIYDSMGSQLRITVTLHDKSYGNMHMYISYRNIIIDYNYTFA